MKVAFRRVSEKDLRRLNEIVNDPDVARYLALIPPVSMNSSRGMYERVRREKSHWYCIIVDGVVAGSVWIQGGRKDSKQAHVTEFGISIAREYWGMGVGDKAMKFMINKSRELGLKRIQMIVVEDNRRARRLYEKHGFRREGVQKKSFKIGRRYHNTIMMARLLK
jgi:RimJ/RimL family protein N-acetyltransferase